MKLGEIDEIALDVSGTVLERLDTPKADAAVDEESDEEEVVAGPIAIAVDLTDSEAAPENTPA